MDDTLLMAESTSTPEAVLGASIGSSPAVDAASATTAAAQPVAAHEQPQQASQQTIQPAAGARLVQATDSGDSPAALPADSTGNAALDDQLAIAFRLLTTNYASGRDGTTQQPQQQQQQYLQPQQQPQAFDPPGLGPAGASPPHATSQAMPMALPPGLGGFGTSSSSGTSLPGADSGALRPPRKADSKIDVDAAKKAVQSALAGLDLATAKVNLDASKAAASAARAEASAQSAAPAAVTRVRGASRSVSARQLGAPGPSGSSLGPSGLGAGASAAGGFYGGAAAPRLPRLEDGDVLSELGAARRSHDNGFSPLKGFGMQQQATPQWPGPSMGAMDMRLGEQRRPVRRGPAARAISLPHILQGREAAANRLAQSLAQDAALQRHLQLLQGGGGVNAGMTLQQQLQAQQQNEVLALWQQQQQQQQQQFGGAGGAGLRSMDDSVLLQQQAMLRQQLQQQQQAQWGGVQQQLNGNWANGGGSGAANAAAVAQAEAQQLLAQAAGARQQQLSPPGAAGMWAGNHAGTSVSAAQHGFLKQQATQQLGLDGVSGDRMNDGQQLLDSYTAASWQALALAQQADAPVREQLVAEVTLLLAALNTMLSVSNGAPSSTTVNDLTFLSAAARNHVNACRGLSQPGAVAVQLMALIAQVALHPAHTNGDTAPCEAVLRFLLELSSANPELHPALAQCRTRTQPGMPATAPPAAATRLIAGLAAAATRNQQLLEAMSQQAGGQQLRNAPSGASATAPAPTPLPIAIPGVGTLSAGPPGLQQAQQQPPGLVAPSPTVPSTSPGNASGQKTPLATWFEAQQQPGPAPARVAQEGLPSLPPALGAIASSAPLVSAASGRTVPGAVSMLHM